MTITVTQKEQTRISHVMKYAEDNVYSMDDMLDLMNGAIQPAGDDPNHVCELPDGYKIVYSIETQPHFIAKHISISKNQQIPSPLETQLIMGLFGFSSSLDNCHVYFEKGIAVNVIEPLVC